MKRERKRERDVSASTPSSSVIIYSENACELERVVFNIKGGSDRQDERVSEPLGGISVAEARKMETGEK